MRRWTRDRSSGEALDGVLRSVASARLREEPEDPQPLGISDLFPDYRAYHRALRCQPWHSCSQSRNPSRMLGNSPGRGSRPEAAPRAGALAGDLPPRDAQLPAACRFLDAPASAHPRWASCRRPIAGRNLRHDPNRGTNLPRLGRSWPRAAAGLELDHRHAFRRDDAEDLGIRVQVGLEL